MTDRFEFEKVMRQRGFTKKKIASCLGITVQGLDKKLNNESEFKASELYTLSNLLGIDIGSSIFFNKDVN